MSTDSARKAAERIMLYLNSQPSPEFLAASTYSRVEEIIANAPDFLARYIAEELSKSGELEVKAATVEELASILRDAACQTVAPPRECGMHAGMGCLDASCHHFLKYHDPKSDFYIGGECVNCCFGQVERERGASPAVSTPRCPKCRSEVEIDVSRIQYDAPIQVDCSRCGETFNCSLLADFAQFFQPAPSLPQGQLDMSICKCDHAKAGHISGVGYCTACDCGEFKERTKDDKA